MTKISAQFSALTKALNAFVKENFSEDYSVRMGADFYVDLDSDVIYYSVITPEKDEKSFCENFIKRFPACADISPLMLSFMHEVGHLEEEWQMIDDTAERELCTECEEYYDLFNERIATDFAGEWLTAHHDFAKETDKKFITIYEKILDKILD
jgi:hypothetical protein